jgi:hypothetical protein
LHEQPTAEEAMMLRIMIHDGVSGLRFRMFCSLI